MATSGDLVRIVAYALELAPETVFIHMRNLRVAELISKKGHGRSAAKMTPLDATRLLLASAGSAFAKDSVETTREFGQMKRASFTEDLIPCEKIPQLSGWDTLENAICEELTLFSTSHAKVRSFSTSAYFEFFARFHADAPALKFFLSNQMGSATKAAFFCKITDAASKPSVVLRVGFSNLVYRDWDDVEAPPTEVLWDSKFVREGGYPRSLRTHSVYPEALAIIAVMLNDDLALEKLDERIREEQEHARIMTEIEEDIWRKHQAKKQPR